MLKKNLINCGFFVPLFILEMIDLEVENKHVDMSGVGT